MLLPISWQNAQARQDGIVEVNYEATDAIFANPERGFYSWTEGVPGGPMLSPASLRAHRDENRTIIIRLYYIAEFRDADFTDDFLSQIEADFAAMREAGIKCILRFRYSKSETEPDAPLERVLAHLEQLRPVFERNHDVIAAAQAGFIGAWGEWHASSNNLTSVANMRAVLFMFLEVLPERHIQIRYPQAKMQIFETHTPIGPEQAFDGSNISRTGHHNDCFLASRNDVGTYRISPTWEKNYLSHETRYVPMGGETCRVREGEYYLCENALHEMEWLRWSYLNNSYYRGIIDHWIEEGCMPDVMRRLGYRFALRNGSYSAEVRPGSSMRFQLHLENEGFASPFNRRGVQAILRSVFNPEIVYEVSLPADPRFWSGGDAQTLAFDLGISADMPPGLYQTFLFLPDPAPGLRSRSEYAIRLANSDVWEETTGYNDLMHVLHVNPDAEGEDYTGSLWFTPEGTATAASDGSRDLPSSIRLHQNYPNPFNPSTTIRFELAQAQRITLELFNVVGQRVLRLLEGKHPAGKHTVTLDGSDLPGGVYYYALNAGQDRELKSMVLLK